MGSWFGDLNQRDKLKEQKKRLQDYLGSKTDAMSAGNVSGKDSFSITCGMLKANPIGAILPILESTKWYYSRSLKRILSNFYYSVRHTTTLLSGVRKSRMRPCGKDFAMRGN